MSHQTSSASVAEYVLETPSFLSNSIDLKGLLRAVKRHQQVAIDALVKIITESLDEGNRLRAAVKLLELNVQVAKELSDDQLKRLVAEIRMNQASQALVPHDQANRPLVDFETVRTV